jgi:PAS domain S-box-containing protein
MRNGDQFRQESQQLHHRRVYIILLVGIGVMALFTLLDYLLIRAHFFEFLRYRLFAVGFVGLLLLANYLDRQCRRAWMIGFAGYLCAGSVILLTVHRLGGITSPYYVGLLVAMTIYTALAPLTVAQTLASGFALICGYLVSLSLMASLTHYQLMSLFSNLFFLICFVFIAATQSWADTTARTMEYRLRRAENEAADRLARRADQLEQEVRRRTEEQRSMEQRYRILYEAIADAVVLVNSRGQVLQANSMFTNCFFGGSLPPEGSLFDVVPPADRSRVQQELLAPLERGASISAWQITLRSLQGQALMVEINGALLVRGNDKLGLQLVIRDIGIRKELEQRLLLSLDRIRQTENAAILALAKISEYRDVTPGNHLERMREYCRILATELAHRQEYRETITPVYLQNLYQGAILHDIGKVALPDRILHKGASLTDEEMRLYRQHTVRGGDVIKAIEEEAKGSGFLSIARNIAYCHHERWDGQGYPFGLYGENIPMEARILALADAYEELTAPLEPDKRLSHADAVQRIVDEVGQRFDPVIVEAFVLHQDTFDWVRQSLQEPVARVPAASPPPRADSTAGQG